MIISIKNNKGGVGKSWLTFNLGHGLAMMGKKVLILTSDSQNNILTFAGFELRDYKGLESLVLKNDCDVLRIRDNLYYIPLADNNFSQKFREKIKKKILDLKNEYDYILIDSVPTLAVDKEFQEISNKIIVPSYMDDVSILGIDNMLKNTVDKNKILAIVPNRFNNTKNERDRYAELKKILDGNKILLTDPIKQTSFVGDLIAKNKTVWDSYSKKIEETCITLQIVLKEILKNENN
ncbi:ParA family protein [Cetobacterium sp.]|uniref:ParA family protein n=1 Tax=Cetobacterium sp. TaxID=2071632 RepID=UPI003F301A5A